MSNREYKEEYVMINGIEQYLLHYTAKPEDPVLVFVHGGPGSSESPMAYVVEDYDNRNYNIVYYDQRGAGKTYRRNKKAKATFENLQDDLYQIILYLKQTYNKEKIGIVGHSWGTVLGSLCALAHPEHVLFYVGCGQVVNAKETEIQSYKKLSEAIDQSGNAKDKKQLEKIGEYPGEGKYDKDFLRKMGAMRKLQGKYDLAISADADLIKLIWKSPIIGLGDIPSSMFGAMINMHLISSIMEFDIYQYGSTYEVPVYYVLGEKDQQTPTDMGVAYFETIEAPVKRLYIIKNAGHGTMIDNPDDYRKAINEICNIWRG